MKRLWLFGCLFLVMIVTSCSRANEDTGSVESPAKSSEVNSAETSKPASRLCSLFSTAEIKNLVGASVGDGYVTGPLNSACRWDNSRMDETAVYAQIQMMDTQYWEKHTGAQGYEVLHGIGKEAFVASSLGGWEAGTLTDKAVVFVSVYGGSAGRDTAVKFLRDTLGRLAQK